MHMHIGQQILYLLFRQKGKLLQFLSGSCVQVQLLLHPPGEFLQFVFPVGAFGLGGQLLQIFFPKHQVRMLGLQGQTNQTQQTSYSYPDVSHYNVSYLFLFTATEVTLNKLITQGKGKPFKKDFKE